MTHAFASEMFLLGDTVDGFVLATYAVGALEYAAVTLAEGGHATTELDAEIVVLHAMVGVVFIRRG